MQSATGEFTQEEKGGGVGRLMRMIRRSKGFDSFPDGRDGCNGCSQEGMKTQWC